MVDEVKFLRREWLNKDIGSASIDYSVYKSNNKGYPYIDADLSIRDCTRQISLDFSINYEDGVPVPKSIENIKYKMQILQEVIKELEQKLLEALMV